MSASVMDARLVLLAALLAALLSTCSDSRETSDDGVKEIYASAGEVVVLPCEINDTDRDNPTVEWSTDGLGRKNITFLYRDGCEDFAMKNKDYQFRTSLFMNEVQNGNISLRISNVQPSDAGKHECSIIVDNKPKVITTLELIVCAAPEPKLSVIDVETLQCEVNSSLPSLNMTFLDHQGKIINAEEPKRDPDSSGCFNFRGEVKVLTATDSITCRVHQPQTNQSKDAQIYLSAKDKKSCPVWSFVAGAVAGAAFSIDVVVFVAVAAFAVGIGLGFLLCFFRDKLFPKCVGRNIPPVINQQSVQSTDKQDVSSYLMENPTDSSQTMDELEYPFSSKGGLVVDMR